MTHLHVGLSSETTEKARLELNENPDTLHHDIQQVNNTTGYTGLEEPFKKINFICTKQELLVGCHGVVC